MAERGSWERGKNRGRALDDAATARICRLSRSGTAVSRTRYLYRSCTTRTSTTCWPQTTRSWRCTRPRRLGCTWQACGRTLSAAPSRCRRGRGAGGLAGFVGWAWLGADGGAAGAGCALWAAAGGGRRCVLAGMLSPLGCCNAAPRCLSLPQACPATRLALLLLPPNPAACPRPARRPRQVLELLECGERHRHTGETRMNKSSSRSHTVFRMVVESRSRDANPDDAQVCGGWEGGAGYCMRCGSGESVCVHNMGAGSAGVLMVVVCLCASCGCRQKVGGKYWCSDGRCPPDWRHPCPTLHPSLACPTRATTPSAATRLPTPAPPPPTLPAARTLAPSACLPSPWWTWPARSALPRRGRRGSA